VVDLEARVTELTSCLASAEARAAELVALKAVQSDCEWRFAELENSWSWRMTKPLRAATAGIRRAFGR
jgi:hypothetical protein